MLDAIGQGGGAPPPSDAGSGGDPEDLIRQAIELLDQFAQTSQTDDIETQTARECATKLQGVLATAQKNQEAASGTTGAHKAMAKQINSIAGQVYGG